jgi:GNAT superfamily N-acetyltransferase
VFAPLNEHILIEIMGCAFCIPSPLGTDPGVYFPDGLPNSVVHLTPDSSPELIEEFIEGLAVGFCGTATSPPEAVNSWSIGTPGVVEHAKPLPLDVVENKEELQKRKVFFRYLVDFMFVQAARHGGCFALKDEKEGKLCSYALTFPPNNKGLHSPGLCEFFWVINQLGGYGKIHPAFVEGEESQRMGIVEQTFRASHEKHAHSPHMYIYAMATKPGEQGKGHGTTLLRHILSVADRMKVPTYLESGGEKNDRFYTKSGFEVVERVPMTYVSAEKTKEYGMLTEVPFKPDGLDGLEGVSVCVRPYDSLGAST